MSGAAGESARLPKTTSPVFFLSYAHSPDLRRSGQLRKRNARFRVFFDDVSENVAELVSRPIGHDPGYMDRMLPDGHLCTDSLLAAIGTCRVFVALLSPRYVTSEMCGKEWFAFSRRRVTGRDPAVARNPTAIIPVTWAPVDGMKIPAAIDNVPRFSPDSMPSSVARYERDGVVGLQLLDDDAYHALVWRLAQRIATIYYTHDVEPHVCTVDELRNIFREQAV